MRARDRQAISQLLRELNAEDSARDSKAKPARRLILWTDKTELAVVAVAIARVVTPEEAGVVKRGPSLLKVRLLSLVMVLLLMVPLLKRRRELLVRDVSAFSPPPLSLRRKSAIPSTTTSQISKLNLRACSLQPVS